MRLLSASLTGNGLEPEYVEEEGDYEVKGGKPSPGTPKDRRLSENQAPKPKPTNPPAKGK
jgi:hypothetical protein